MKCPFCDNELEFYDYGWVIDASLYRANFPSGAVYKEAFHCDHKSLHPDGREVDIVALQSGELYLFGADAQFHLFQCATPIVHQVSSKFIGRRKIQ